MGAWKRMNYKHFINLTTYKLKSLKHYCRQEWPIGVSPSTANYALLADATCSETTGLTHSSWPRQQIKSACYQWGGCIPALQGPSARTINHATEAGMSKTRPSGNIPGRSDPGSPSQQVTPVVYSLTRNNATSKNNSLQQILGTDEPLKYLDTASLSAV